LYCVLCRVECGTLQLVCVGLNAYCFDACIVFCAEWSVVHSSSVRVNKRPCRHWCMQWTRHCHGAHVTATLSSLRTSHVTAAAAAADDDDDDDVRCINENRKKRNCLPTCVCCGFRLCNARNASDCVWMETRLDNNHNHNHVDLCFQFCDDRTSSGCISSVVTVGVALSTDFVFVPKQKLLR